MCPGHETIKIILLNGQIERHHPILMTAVSIRKEKMFSPRVSETYQKDDSDCIVAIGPG